MNVLENRKEKGLSLKGSRIINIIIGCIMVSGLDNKNKRECVEFMRQLEDYLDGDEDSEF